MCIRAADQSNFLFLLPKMTIRFRDSPLFLIGILICNLLGSLTFAQWLVTPNAPRTLRSNGHGREWAERTLKSLSLEEKVGQLLQDRYYVDYKSFDTFAYKYVRGEVQKYHIGSVVLGMHFDRNGALRSSPEEAARCINQLQSDSKLPLLIAADVERGVARIFILRRSSRSGKRRGITSRKTTWSSRG